MTIRLATAQDAAAIASLWNVMIRDTTSTFTSVEKAETQIADLIRERRGALLIAERDSRFAGFVTFGPFRSGPGYAATAEHTILVTPKAHGKGVGRALMTAAEDAARARQIHVMIAGISHTNDAAQSFHEKLGYVEVGRLPQVGRKADQWLDLVLMQKIL
ncbi:GNAT family N-acetyltransferase [Roseobacter sp. YSTF-M11]|uniref:GNAT family N-acetyltransferase n=1 Tax=Roseobacter insulae TaxID=2859783 RepID=A0A9X1JXW3_9RHOB|nr:GNAT family N-acetyltransferase [Roseobacter insulae]MBW4707566.1 GNAT family N-acetyltransferase [Roseobacter insulae]